MSNPEEVKQMEEAEDYYNKIIMNNFWAMQNSAKIMSLLILIEDFNRL